MAEAHRRIILKPAQLGKEERSRLADLLSAAADLQNQFASRSVHVLQLVGGIQETEHAFWIEHEPATPFPVAELFNPELPPPADRILLRMAAALFDALRVTHGSSGDRPQVHGGICPGVIVKNPDGIDKVTDFGFAPALCAVLGVDGYLNLAVSPRTEGPDEEQATGVWEALAPGVADRDDRICAFIDPEKCGLGQYDTFERQSDIIAAGIFLHLLAERRHPYFPDDPTLHRMVDVADYMAMGGPTTPRRQELQESSDPAVRLWCELVAKMVDRIPQNRPSASALAEEFGQYEGPAGLAEVLRHRFEVVCAQLGEGPAEDVPWDDVSRRATRLRDSEAAPPDVVEQADALVRVNAAREALQGETWRDAAGLVDKVLGIDGLPESIALRAGEIKEVVDGDLGPWEELDQIQAVFAASVASDMEELLEALVPLHDRLDRLEADGPYLPAVGKRLAALRTDMSSGLTENMLDASEPDVTPDTVSDLARAKLRVEHAMRVPRIPQALQVRAEELRNVLAEKQRVREVLDYSEGAIERLRRSEVDIAEARQHLTEERFGEAEARAKEVLDSEFPHMREQAERTLHRASVALEGYRAQLGQHLEAAAEHFAQERFDEAIAEAEVVANDACAGEALLVKAREQIEAARVAQMGAEEARLQAIADHDQALAALRDGDIATARQRAEAVLANRRSERDVQEGAKRVLGQLPELEAAQALVDQQDYPGAMQAFDGILQNHPDTDQPPGSAAVLLRRRATALRAEALLGGMESHLERRAGLEQETPDLDGVPLDEGLSRTAPAWMVATLANFETFLQDCTVLANPAPPADTLGPGERLGEKYEVLEFLGRGGMGEVYRARDLSLDREVALKLAPAPAKGAAEDDALAEALRTEAKVIAALNHPHIIHINSLDVIDDRPCFNTNYIRGRDLAEHVRDRELSAREIAETLAPIAEALAYAHEQGVLHRDVKPQNIYLGEGPEEGPWLIDFGLARMRTIYDRRANTGLCGTPGYIAPEVITSMGNEVDHRADIFGLGCVLYGLLAKAPPFQHTQSSRPGSRPSVSRTLLNTLRSHVRPLSQAAPIAPEPLRRICERAMAYELEDRYQTAAEMGHDLRRFLLQSYQQQTETALAEARARLEERPRNEPAELDALDETAELTEGVKRMAEEARRRAEDTPGLAEDACLHDVDEARRQAVALAEEVQGLKKDIVDSQGDANRQLEAATEALADGRYRPALTSAQTVLGNPYVPDLHANAGDVAARAGQGLDAARKKRLAFAAVGVLVVAAAGVGVFWSLSGGEPSEPGTPPSTPVRADATPTPELAVATPAITPNGGTVTGATEVRLACETPDATIRYTLDGSDPTADSPQYVEPLKLTDLATVRARAFKDGANDSEIATARFTIAPSLTVATPMITPDGGTYTGSVAVALACETPGATIRYTTDGSDPTSDSTQYADPFKLADSATVKARAFKESANDSGVVSAQFTLTPSATVAAPTISPNGGTSAGSVEVTLSCETPEATIRYTLDGAEPTAASPGYREPVKLTQTATVRARAFKQGANPSEIASAQFTVTPLPPVATPTMNPNGGTFPGTVSIELACNTPEASIRYTTDGTDPTASSTEFARAFELTQTATVRVRAFKEGASPSEIASAQFTITPLPTVAAVTISPNKGSFPGSVTVTLACQDAEAAIRYTTDGTDPTADATQYTEPFKLIQTSTVKARAFREGLKESEIASARLRVTPAPDIDKGEVLEEQLLKDFPGAAVGVPQALDDLARATGYLGDLAKIKWASGQAKMGDLAARTNSLRIALNARTGGWAQPNRFIEYFWGPKHVHALYWRADGATIAARYVRLGEAAGMTEQIKQAVASGTVGEALGTSLLGPIVSETGFFTADAGTASFGVAIAPHGPLCFVPMARLPFPPVDAVLSVLDPATERTASAMQPKRMRVGKLGDVCTGPRLTCQTGLWTFVSLASPPSSFASGSGHRSGVRKLWGGPWRTKLSQPTAFNSFVLRDFEDDLLVYRDRDVTSGVFSALRGMTERIRIIRDAPAEASFYRPRIDDKLGDKWFLIVATPVP